MRSVFRLLENGDERIKVAERDGSRDGRKGSVARRRQLHQSVDLIMAAAQGKSVGLARAPPPFAFGKRKSTPTHPHFWRRVLARHCCRRNIEVSFCTVMPPLSLRQAS